MRPLLKIGPLTNLQDARSSAAVGFDLISFSLERGNNRKLPASLVWNITQWLSGPEIILELNRVSLPELGAIEKSVSYAYLSFPFEDWTPELLQYPGKQIVRADEHSSPSKLAIALKEANKDERVLFVQLSVSSVQAIAPFSEIVKDSLVHFSDLDKLQQFISKNAYNPFGFCLGEEAEEEPGCLHYERIDELLQVYADRFSEE